MWSRLSKRNPCPRDHEIYNFGRSFLGYYYIILSLSELCLEVEKKIFKVALGVCFALKSWKEYLLLSHI